MLAALGVLAGAARGLSCGTLAGLSLLVPDMYGVTCLFSAAQHFRWIVYLPCSSKEWKIHTEIAYHQASKSFFESRPHLFLFLMG